MPPPELERGNGYRPAQEFEEVENEALVDLHNLPDSSELWLLQVPFSNDFLSDIDGKELSVKLDGDGKLASFEGSSGKVYDFITYADQEPDETVFVPSATVPKIAGKISRRISVVHYPDPEEYEKEKLNSINTRHAHRNSAGVTTSQYFPIQSSNPRSSQSGRAASSKGSRLKSSLSEFSEPSKSAKRKPVSRSIMSEDPSGHDISHGHNTGISAMSSDHSEGGKSKRKCTE